MPYVDQTLLQMRALLRSQQWAASSLLVNGKTEIALKALFGLAWESLDPDSHAFVTDKGFRRHPGRGGPGGVDFVALRAGAEASTTECVFWAELKACHLADKNDIKSSAERAVEQVESALGGEDIERELIGELAEAPAYIVHFLTPVPLEQPRLARIYDHFDWLSANGRRVSLLDKYGHALPDDVRLALENKIYDVFVEEDKEIIEAWRSERLEVLTAIYEAHGFESVKVVVLSIEPRLYAVVVKI